MEELRYVQARRGQASRAARGLRASHHGPCGGYRVAAGVRKTRDPPSITEPHPALLKRVGSASPYGHLTVSHNRGPGALYPSSETPVERSRHTSASTHEAGVMRP